MGLRTFEIVMTVESPQESLPRRAWRKLTSGKFLYLSILLHILFALIAVALVVQVISPKRKIVFTSAPPANRPVEHEVQMAKKQKSMSAPAPAKRITTTGLSKIALPEMPPMPSMEPSMPASMAGVGGPAVGFGSAGGMGSGSGTGSGGIPFFGVRDKGQGLPGTFYDLKQTRSHQDAKVSVQDYHETVAKFVNQHFSEGVLTRFFRSSNPIYAPQIFIPVIDAQDGPKAFNLEKQVKPSRWMIVYEGKVRAPEAGNFRFVGFADDILVVRVDGKMVLDGSLANVTGWKPVKIYPYTLNKDRTVGFRVGEWFRVNFGQEVDIQILIGEQPGGLFYAQLFIEKEYGAYRKTPRGTPILPIFKVARVPDPALKPGVDGAADFAKNSGKVWMLSDQATPGALSASLLKP